MALSHLRPEIGSILALVIVCTLGSAAGCVVLYFAGRKGGQVILGKFDEQRRVQVREQIERYGFWAVLGSVMGPPPVPTKLFVLSAGVFGMRISKLLAGVIIGRTIRYSVSAYLAVTLGDRAVVLLRSLL